MPNWCSNQLSVYGKIEDMKPFINTIRIDGGEYALLEKLYPTPQDLLDGEGWYNWRIHNWGTKWAENDLYVSQDYTEKDGYAKICFDFESAWSPPTDAFDKISNDYKGLLFSLYYEEPGMGFCGYSIWANGEVKDSMQSDLIQRDFDEEYLYEEYFEEEENEMNNEEIIDENTTSEETTMEKQTLMTNINNILKQENSDEFAIACGINIDNDNVTYEILGKDSDVYELIDSVISAKSAEPFEYVSIITWGWAAPLNENGEVEGAPSKHKDRRRVKLIISGSRNEGMIGSVINFQDDLENPVFDFATATGSLNDAFIAIFENNN